MMSEIEKTCENCKYEHEDIYGKHCRHCIRNADEFFEPKDESISEIIQEVCEDMCDNYCKYRDTTKEDNLCDMTRNGGECPLDRLQ